MACRHNAECKLADVERLSRVNGFGREYDSQAGRAIFAGNRGIMADEWEEKHTKHVARTVHQRDMVDVCSCSVKRRPLACDRYLLHLLETLTPPQFQKVVGQFG
jgi:hypothetical protein